MSELMRIPDMDGKERYIYGVGIGGEYSNAYDGDTSMSFDGQNNGTLPKKSVVIRGKKYEYFMWGEDDQMPYRMRNAINDNMICAQAQLYNYQSTYGQGPLFKDIETGVKTKDATFRMFDMINHLKSEYMEMCIDIKMYYFTVVVFILNKDGNRIAHFHHKEAQNCRFTTDLKYILYGNFEDGGSVDNDNIEVIPWLDNSHPEEDFLQRTGKIVSYQDGLRHVTKEKKFGMVCRFPTVGFQVYPWVTWMSILRDRWYDIYSLIGEGKRTKIKNSTSPRFLVEINKEYWYQLCEEKGVTDELAKIELIKEHRKKIEDYVCGIANSGKVWIAGYQTDPNGKEISMVKITNLESGKKEGGDWADDIQEASNVLCFAFGVHPNLIGATPGKTAMNNSGSDKRELFTLKQALDTCFRDALLPPFNLLLYFNGWSEKIEVEIPIVQLTTLDKGKDAQLVSNSNTSEE